MNKEVVKNAIICLSHLKIEDTTYQIARDIVLDELEAKDKEIERLHSIIKEVREYIQTCGCDDKAIDYIENILDKVGNE